MLYILVSLGGAGESERERERERQFLVTKDNNYFNVNAT